ncbi:unnamed protein product [Parascedosporium putredinis]|uniref:Uncharacterized protein n=1 Tax=Parascedosporium putredinis TaxID=1442378 RepID=A0A9P1H269_9PEZI|nr:unnamed protein product [Parascedosporium putredinis]CAI7994646.1 unnamed protein product [Parascedosporium putredinis]
MAAPSIVMNHAVLGIRHSRHIHFWKLVRSTAQRHTEYRKYQGAIDNYSTQTILVSGAVRTSMQQLLSPPLLVS